MTVLNTIPGIGKSLVKNTESPVLTPKTSSNIEFKLGAIQPEATVCFIPQNVPVAKEPKKDEKPSEVYDARGRLIKRISKSYDDKGKLTETKELTRDYGRSGRFNYSREEKCKYNDKGEIEARTIKHYDGAGKFSELIEEKYNMGKMKFKKTDFHHIVTGKFCFTSEEEYKYNDKGKIEAKIIKYYDANKILNSLTEEEYKYNDKGEIEAKIIKYYDANKILNSLTEEKYEYDATGKIKTEICKYYDAGNNKPSESYETENKYDDATGEIKAVTLLHYAAGKLEYLKEETNDYDAARGINTNKVEKINYYPKSGNVKNIEITTEQYDLKGKLVETKSTVIKP